MLEPVKVGVMPVYDMEVENTHNFVANGVFVHNSGKSTVFSESFKWLLTGAISESQRPGDHVKNRQSDKTEVSANFEFDGIVHELGRFRHPNNLTIDGSKVEQFEIDALFPLSDEAMSRSIFISQFADLFLSMKPEEKSRLFSETLDLDKWIVAADKAGKEISRIEKLVRELEYTLAGIAGSKETAEKTLLDAENDEKAWSKDRRSRLIEARHELAEIEALKDQTEEALIEARSKGNSNDSSAKTELNDVKLIFKQRSELLRQADRQKAVNVSDEVERLEQERSKYKKSVTVCPECGQKVSQHHIADKWKKVDRALQIAYAEFNSRVDAVTELTKNIEWFENRIAQLEESLIGFNTILQEVAVAAEKAQNNVRQWNAAKTKVQSIKEEINPHTAQCDRLAAAIQRDEKREKQLKKDIEQRKTELEIYEFWQKGFKEIRLEQIDTTLVELELATNKHAAELGLDDYYIEFATERETKSGKIAHGFSVMLYTPDSPDEPVPFEMYCGGEKQRWQLASTFGLAEVLLTRAGVSTDFEFIDEPTQHISDEGVDDLLECLKERAEKTDRRIFLIDHRVLNKGAFDGVITCTKDKTGTHVKYNGSGFVVKERNRLSGELVK